MERGRQSMLVRSVGEWNVLRKKLVSVRGGVSATTAVKKLRDQVITESHLKAAEQWLNFSDFQNSSSIAMIEHLPQELRDRFTEMREMDLSVQRTHAFPNPFHEKNHHTHPTTAQFHYGHYTGQCVAFMAFATFKHLPFFCHMVGISWFINPNLASPVVYIQVAGGLVVSEGGERHAKLHLDGFISAWVHRHDTDCQTDSCQADRAIPLPGLAQIHPKPASPRVNIVMSQLLEQMAIPNDPLKNLGHDLENWDDWSS
ncbi:hypothetical protein PR048_013477 [Dryococelus australis]|uniref:Inhibitor of growth protein N-terminal histone-binding domain-containing protein n=1 Tax=Dryococelus australis TaxID=614101 RepID=A0ABQ9HSB4_9NEOP|nr:hypothetical protein PR048_013477 [Dryococelus australis]